LITLRAMLWKRRRVGMALVAVIGLLWSAGCFVVSRAIDETYSAGWRSSTSNDARRRGVFVSSPVVKPAVVAASGAVDLRVIDAWVEHPTHIEYTWVFLRHEVRDSTYRLITHLAKMPHSETAWTDLSRRCFAFVDFYLNGARVGVSGDFAHEELIYQSTVPIPDTVQLRVERHGHVGPPPGAPPSDVPDCP
jgi:hypothetical protein